MLHIFHFLPTSLVFEVVNPFSWIFNATSSDKSCLISTSRRDTKIFPACWILIGQFKFPARRPYATKEVHGKPRLYASVNLFFGVWHDNHEKINSWVSFSFPWWLFSNFISSVIKSKNRQSMTARDCCCCYLEHCSKTNHIAIKGVIQRAKYENVLDLWLIKNRPTCFLHRAKYGDLQICKDKTLGNLN